VALCESRLPSFSLLFPIAHCLSAGKIPSRDLALCFFLRDPVPLLNPANELIASAGTDGAAIGYPGGGQRTISVARVRGHAEYAQYDIYSQHTVDRAIYVLRSTVIPGNSGGPFVDTDGRVRGMIYAASSQYKDEAYALDGAEIDKAIQAADGKTRQVDTKTCAIE